MAKITPMMNHQTPSILMQLDDIEKGENVVYFTGSNLSKCPDAIKYKITELRKQGRITLTTRRASFPYNKETKKLDRTKGVGTFHYIAQGLKGP